MIETYSLKFPKIKMRTKLRVLTIVLILLAFIFAFIFKDTTYWTIAVTTLFSCGLWYQYLTNSRENPQQYFCERLVFDAHKIIIGETIYETDTLNNLKILINDFDGEIIPTARADKMILNGTNNQLSFSYANKSVCFHFYIVSEVQQEQFKELFDGWYKNKLKFYEGNIRGRTYLLQTLNYHQIQEFKNNYELT